MSRWIDADALEYDTEWSEYHDGYTGYSQIAIDTAPSIDIVRCKECKSYYTKAYQDGYGYCEGHCSVMQDNDFCSYGKRKESE